MAERLLDRLEDCKRTFPRVAVLGGAGEAVVSRLCGGRAGIESAVVLDSSPAMLERCRERVSLAMPLPGISSAMQGVSGYYSVHSKQGRLIRSAY